MQQELIAGDSLSFLTTVSEYPASSGWVLKFRLVPRTGTNSAIELTAAAEGELHRTTASAASTSAWAADNYTWASWVEKGAEVYSIENGQIVVKPNPRTVAAGHDGRSEAEKALDDANAALAAWTPTTRRYKINGREMEFNGQADILAIISHWTMAVQREQAAKSMAAGRPNPRKMQVRMGRA